MARARIDEAVGLRAAHEFAAIVGEREDAANLARSTRATAVRYLLQALSDRAPGASVEVRIPPFGAVQCIEGPGHTRGTPPNVVEMDAATWVALACGVKGWHELVEAGRIHASGTRADEVARFLPVIRITA